MKSMLKKRSRISGNVAKVIVTATKEKMFKNYSLSVHDSIMYEARETLNNELLDIRDFMWFIQDHIKEKFRKDLYYVEKDHKHFLQVY